MHDFADFDDDPAFQEASTTASTTVGSPKDPLQIEFEADFEAQLDSMFFEQVRLARPRRDDLRVPSKGNRKWCTWNQAGWSLEDQNFARQETEQEWRNQTFQTRLLEHTIKSGIQCCTSYNKQLHYFQKPDNVKQYLHDMQTAAQVPDGGRTAIFVLGPSAAGKTSIVASLGKLKKGMAYQFPAMTFDGADAREVSEIWKRYAQNGGAWRVCDGCRKPGSQKDGTRAWNAFPAKGCLLAKYFEDVAKPHLKPNLNKLMFEWIHKFRPKTVLIPETAVPCVTTAFEKVCKILKLIEQFRKLGYKIKFVVVYAPLTQVTASGRSRALTEGKPYSSSAYAFALYSAKQLYKRFRNTDDFIFVNNTYQTDKLPELLDWETYKKVVKESIAVEIAKLLM